MEAQGHAGQPMQRWWRCAALGKRYGVEGRKRDGSVTQALDHVSFAVACGEFTGIMGPSGSGKSTLLNCLATIDAPTSGSIVVGGRDVTVARRQGAGEVPARGAGLHLPGLEPAGHAHGVREHRAGADHPEGARARDRRARAEAARTLGIDDVLQKYPYQMSGGQKQRVAAARATVGRPRLVLADEPTGALDSKSARQLLESLAYLNSRGSTILMVTHDSFSASYCNRIVFIKDGGLYGELRRSARRPRRRSTADRGRGVHHGRRGRGRAAEGEVARHAC